jgi:endoglucanase
MDMEKRKINDRNEFKGSQFMKNIFLTMVILFVMALMIYVPLTSQAYTSAPYGRLSVQEGKLVGEDGNQVQLKGFSSHGIQWFPEFLNEESFAYMKKNWNVNLVRVAMYTAQGGYLEDKSVEETLDRIVEDAIKVGVYVIIDWHILYDNDPLANVDEAVEFFERQAKKHGNTPHVIFEIANEPNGNVTWEGNIVPYAKRVIPAIRKHSKNIIIVGTPTWSQELDKPLNNPISGENIMYAFHFYAGSHDHLMSRIEEAARANLPIFVTEWGTSHADGNGSVEEEKIKEWLGILDKYKISWANWNLADKDEASSALKPGAPPTGGWTHGYLSPSGKIVVDALINKPRRLVSEENKTASKDVLQGNQAETIETPQTSASNQLGDTGSEGNGDNNQEINSKETQTYTQNEESKSDNQEKVGFFERLLSVIRKIFNAIKGSEPDDNIQGESLGENTKKTEEMPKLSVEEEKKAEKFMANLSDGNLQDHKDSEQFLRDIVFRTEKDLSDEKKQDHIQYIRDREGLQKKIAQEVTSPNNIAESVSNEDAYKTQEGNKQEENKQEKTSKVTPSVSDDASGTEDTKEKTETNKKRLKDYPTLLVTLYDKGPQVQLKPGRYTWVKYIDGVNVGDTVLYSYEPYDPNTGGFGEKITRSNVSFYSDNFDFLSAYLGKRAVLQFIHSNVNYQIDIKGSVYNKNFDYPLDFQMNVPNSQHTFDVPKEIDAKVQEFAIDQGDRYKNTRGDREKRVKHYRMEMEIVPKN